ncbi:putative metal dependent phosphohydrolase [Diplodia seriata]|uniref:Putative metal dependent phosphohydrolase n=1 Tax=Diplodia seriata TaxID=420778 RepID=A0A0G2EQC5_9PEZI|nr:putative metal dependent phosphohydrolase [Diplodia seriata]
MSTTTPSLFPALPPTLSHLTALLPRTPLVQAALQHAHAHSAPFAFNHVVRSWLFTALVGRSHPTLRHERIDPEVVAVACLLHDLGWDPTGADGGGGREDGDDGDDDVRGYKGRKTQQVWDACALHTTGSIAFCKEPVVAVVAYGIWADFQGPANTLPPDMLTWADYDAVVRAYLRLGLLGELKDIMCGLCRTKPATTYDNTVGEWGELFVDGYSREGHRTAEMLLKFTPALDARE